MKITHSVPLTTDPVAFLAGLSDYADRFGELRADVGPLQVVYTGSLRMLSLEDSTATFRVNGTELAGQGDADAYAIARVAPGSVSFDVDLTVRGLVARFGGDFVHDVVTQRLDSFVRAVETEPPVAEPDPRVLVAVGAAAVAAVAVAAVLVIRRLRGKRS
ncbi:SRPBCC domain-containing protein [Fodinicola acaciae]|uniref:SRPBCC domain-containing protein n=1 Tax=Fodinicola acaciae TaxID=2681555 RepID=UPI0013D5880D|nr:SRPBCC domain-containing protein [Fodinicola acaciae]